ncbi:MAG: TetR family transcriptional regulator C-terminal domain-containing protein [Alcanivoracaceae bacterium]|nr:TetR family transcriptional regulator C-terminal domain-containing protein [Alcanivoracaceae bacterium]
MLQSLKNWKFKINQLVHGAQLAGEIRNDLTSEQITSVFWAAWEGSLLQMKMEGSIDTANETLYIMLDHLFKPQP